MTERVPSEARASEPDVLSEDSVTRLVSISFLNKWFYESTPSVIDPFGTNRAIMATHRR